MPVAEGVLFVYKELITFVLTYLPLLTYLYGRTKPTVDRSVRVASDGALDCTGISPGF